MATSTTHDLAGLSGAVRGYIRLMDRLSRATAYLAALLFIAGVVVICQMVFVRYVLGMSTSWQTEFTVFAVTGAMLLGSPYVLMTGGHVAITILPDALGGMARRLMLLVASLIGLDGARHRSPYHFGARRALIDSARAAGPATLRRRWEPPCTHAPI